MNDRLASSRTVVYSCAHKGTTSREIEMSTIEYQNHITYQMRRIEEAHAEWVAHTDACSEGLSCLKRKELEWRETSLRNTLAEIMTDAPVGTTIHGFLRLSDGTQRAAYRIKSLSSGSAWKTYFSVRAPGTMRYRICTEFQAERFRVIY